jgi:hypothetical protein
MRRRRPVGSTIPEGWDGKAAIRIVDALMGTGPAS